MWQVVFPDNSLSIPFWMKYVVEMGDFLMIKKRVQFVNIEFEAEYLNRSLKVNVIVLGR